MRTKAAVSWGVGQPWSVEDVEVGEPRCGEVVVKLTAAGLCHSDHHLVTGRLPSADFPIRGGHEGAGVITALGPGVETLAIGDHVVLSTIPSCGTCASCQAGQRNLCDHGTYPSSALGAFSPYAVVHGRSAVKIDPTIPLALACLLSCAVLTGYGAATRSAGVRPGDDVAVIGLGGVGMSAIQGAALAGARHVFAIDPAEWKRDTALTLGATHGYADTRSAMADIADVTRGLMATKVIVAVGDADGKDVDDWLILTAKGGACVLAALGDLSATDVTANLAINILMQKRLQGCLLGGGNPHHDIPLLASMYAMGKLRLDEMVTREYRLDEINDGFQDMLEGKLVRGIIRYGERDWA
ncbi:alcohol dehydrogenase catalytic domain-containing protein [Mycolicibacterium sp.]|uniref:alcohol dehydrogenase catalytic domain-containing protein n=1 Tax=Mycolicibacterium sp. TaxID=2320850 RepID=UPI001A19741D|nr:alcohol dehydrogenase catalytic domain-containing protein [Mycolicibacterium sp.]MBJ7336104.1 alcohol dehydrogenase catalytic domain-containing protein [Mycolicibacterium sp.]